MEHVVLYVLLQGRIYSKTVHCTVQKVAHMVCTDV